ncbi:MAG: Gfo/Idh/MocA family protein [Halobacteriaceae archaeon]
MRFGVLSTANIGQAVLIPAIREAGHEVTAIASRDAARAEQVASELDIARAYGGYEALLADEQIEAVYNPLPNSLHARWTKAAADAGLDVLCEKPLASDAAEARDVVEHCEGAGITLMEAFMWRYHPRTARAVDLASAVGKPRRFEAAFHFPMRSRDNIRLSPDLAGGALMDVGCYAVNAARLFLGEPDRIVARTVDGFDCGVDTTVTAHLEYDDGATAHVAGSFETDWVQRYRLDGTDGYIEATDAFNPQSDPVTLEYAMGERRGTEEWHGINQYAREVSAFVAAVEEDASLRTGPEEAIRNMELLDAIAESAARGAPVSIE